MLFDARFVWRLVCYIRIAHEVFVRIHVSLCENGIFARITNIHFVTNLAPGWMAGIGVWG